MKCPCCGKRAFVRVIAGKTSEAEFMHSVPWEGCACELKSVRLATVGGSKRQLASRLRWALGRIKGL